MDLQKAKAHIENRRADVFSWMEKLIGFESTHGNEAAAISWTADVFANEGLPGLTKEICDDIRRDPEYTCPEKDISFAGRPNFVAARKGSGGGRSLIVNTHIDVVPASDWADAFTPRVEGETIYGRGACDAKGQIAVMLLAHSILKDVGFAPCGDLTWQVVIDEEVGGNGTLALLRGAPGADAAVVLECCDNELHHANRGVLWFKLEVEGRPCHMGRIYDGVSAVDVGIEAVGIFKRYGDELVKNYGNHPDFSMHRQPVQMNIGIFSGGEWVSMVPARATIEGGVGFLPNRTLAQIRDDLRRVIGENGSEWLRGHHTLTFPKLHNDAFSIGAGHELAVAFRNALAAAGIFRGMNGWIVSCDARLMYHVGKMPVVVYGAGRLQDAHSRTEKITFGEIAEAALGLALFIEGWCGRNPQAPAG